MDRVGQVIFSPVPLLCKYVTTNLVKVSTENHLVYICYIYFPFPLFHISFPLLKLISAGQIISFALCCILYLQIVMVSTGNHKVYFSFTYTGGRMGRRQIP